jgi:hypothetical protein
MIKLPNIYEIVNTIDVNGVPRLLMRGEHGWYQYQKGFLIFPPIPMNHITKWNYIKNDN